MAETHQQALSPLDGRYASKTKPMAQIFSEPALIHNRIIIEVKYLLALSKEQIIREFTADEKAILTALTKFNFKHTRQVKTIEQKTHHDVKAVEYCIRQQIQDTSLSDISSYIHFGLTSEDINNLAYRLMIKDGLQVLIKQIGKLLLKIADQAQEQAKLPMLARTHGQAAIPTTLGKEWAVFADRLLPLYQQLKQFQLKGKLNGAVGSFQALHYVYPKTNWAKFSQKFIKQFDFEPLTATTQINPQDDLVQLFQIMQHINLILINLNQDVWRYISDGWLAQAGRNNHIGSSTMPQKINPIQFENSEGNLKMANGLLTVFINQLPVSRLQRDLSDSTVQRNIGTAFGHCLLAYSSLEKGLNKVVPKETKIEQDLLSNWNILSEAAQTLARKQGDEQAYEKLAKQSKNQTINQKKWQEMAGKIDPKLTKLTPQHYLGLAPQIAKQTAKKIRQLIKS